MQDKASPMALPLPPAPAFGEPIEIKAQPGVVEFLARRRSVSALSLAAPAPDADTVAALISLAARTPDHGKLAPWRFIILEGADKDAFAARLEALAQSRGDARAVAKLGKLKTPPLGVAVISRHVPGDIPEWEQRLSAGAACSTLLNAALAAGVGANWITDWYAYDPQACEILGLAEGELVAGYIFMGTAKEAPLERERPDADALTTRWRA